MQSSSAAQLPHATRNSRSLHTAEDAGQETKWVSQQWVAKGMGFDPFAAALAAAEQQQRQGPLSRRERKAAEKQQRQQQRAADPRGKAR